MATSSSSLSSFIIRCTDVLDEPISRMLLPIMGYEREPLVSLEEAIQPIVPYCNGIEANVRIAKEKCTQSHEGLTVDESAAIYLYTMEFDDRVSLSPILNQNLRANNRRNLKPWHLFLKLLLTAFYKLPSSARIVWRFVRDIDLTPNYPKGSNVMWWGISSCIGDISVLEDEHFLGKNGGGTLFHIECQNSISITDYSSVKSKIEEIILLPGLYFRVIDHFTVKKDLHVIHLKEITPTYPLIQPPLLKSTVLSAHEITPKLAFTARSKELTSNARPFDEFPVDTSTIDKPSDFCKD